MTRILTFLGILPSEADLQRDCDAAQAAYDAACARKDTRGQHYAMKRLRTARHALMRHQLRG